MPQEAFNTLTSLLEEVSGQPEYTPPQLVQPTQPATKKMSDQDAIHWGAKELGVTPEELGSVIALESSFNPNVWGGANRGYYGLIQFGKGARKETGLNPDGKHTVASQMPYVVNYFKKRGFDGSRYKDPRERQLRLYNTVLGGNPNANPNSRDAFGTSANSVLDRMLTGDLRKRAVKFLRGSTTPAATSNNEDVVPPVVPFTVPEMGEVGVDGLRPVNFGHPSVDMQPLIQQALDKASVEPVSLNMPSVEPASTTTSGVKPVSPTTPEFDTLNNLLTEVEKQPAPKPPPREVGVKEGLGNIANAVKSGIGGAISGIIDIAKNPKQVSGGIADAFRQEAQARDKRGLTGWLVDPVVGMAGGAVKGVTDLINGVASLPSDIQNAYHDRKVSEPAFRIPTGDLDKVLEDKPVSSFAGSFLPFIAAEAATAGLAPGEGALIKRAADAVNKAAKTGDAEKTYKAFQVYRRIVVRSEKAKRTLEGAAKSIVHGAGAGAVFGGLNDPHGGGLEGRAKAAVDLGALGAVMGAGGAALTKITPIKALKRPDLVPMIEPEVREIGGRDLSEVPPQILDEKGFPINVSRIDNLPKIVIPEGVNYGKPQPEPTIEGTRLKTQAEIVAEREGLTPEPEPVNLVDAQGNPTNKPVEIPKIIEDRGIPEGRDLTTPEKELANLVDDQGNPVGEPVGRIEPEFSNETNPLTGEPYDAGVKSAKESATAIKEGAAELGTAKTIFNDALKSVREQEQLLQKATKVTDTVEAQKALGKRINDLEKLKLNGKTSYIQERELANKRKLLNDLIEARKQLNDAGSLLDDIRRERTATRSQIEVLETSKPIETPKPAETPEPIETPKPAETPLKTSKDLAAERAETLKGASASRAIDLVRHRETKEGVTPRASASVKAKPLKPVDLVTGRGEPLKPENKEVRLFNESGDRTLAGNESVDLVTGKGKAIDLNKKAAAGKSEVIDLNEKAAAGKSEPVQGTHARPDGGYVYAHTRTLEETIDLAEAVERNSEIIALGKAKQLLAKKKNAGLLTQEEAQLQSDILNLFEEAGKNGKTFNSTRREIQEGEGRISKELGKAEEKTRDELVPFAITTLRRQAKTEVESLIKKLGSQDAVKNHLREMAAKYGITPATTGKTPKSNLVKTAELIRKHPKGRMEFEDIYLHAHNYKTGGERTTTDAPRGYPLRTFTSASVGKENAVIHKAAINQNKIKQYWDGVEAIKNNPSTKPETQEILSKLSEKENLSYKDIQKIRKSIKENLEHFCNIWGLK